MSGCLCCLCRHRSVHSESADDDVTLEADVCDVTEVPVGQMKEVEIDGAKVLVVNSDGKFHAIGAKCSHFGASLVNGVLCGDHVRCPWHGACFSIINGDIEDFPGMDSLPKFDASVVDGKVRVRAKKQLLEKTKRPNTIVTSSVPQSRSAVLIIGAGPGATVCAMTLRQQGFKGSITVVGKEVNPPYDRSKLSKAMNSTAEQIALRDPSFYTSNNIQYVLGVQATSVDVSSKTVKFSDNKKLKYDKLVIATGCHARTTTVHGSQLTNIVTLRTIEDGQLIVQQAEGKHVVVVGASFIGIEVAVSLVGKAARVSVLAGNVDAPFETTLGRQVGDVVKQLVEEKGIQFYFKTTVQSFEGDDGKLSGVIMTNGKTLPAQLCVLGIGVLPSTSFLKDSGIKLSEHGHVIVDKHMQTSVTDVYAVGDVVQYPLFMAKDQLVNIQHWQMAHQHGHVCALNIAGVSTDIRSVPFFWTVVCGKSIRYCGYGAGYDDLVIHGDPKELKFVVFYIKSDHVVAVASLNFDPVVSQAAEMFLQGHNLTKSEVSSESWMQRLKEFTSSVTSHLASTQL